MPPGDGNGSNGRLDRPRYLPSPNDCSNTLRQDVPFCGPVQQRGGPIPQMGYGQQAQYLPVQYLPVQPGQPVPANAVWITPQERVPLAKRLGRFFLGRHDGGPHPVPYMPTQYSPVQGVQTADARAVGVSPQALSDGSTLYDYGAQGKVTVKPIKPDGSHVEVRTNQKNETVEKTVGGQKDGSVTIISVDEKDIYKRLGPANNPNGEEHWYKAVIDQGGKVVKNKDGTIQKEEIASAYHSPDGRTVQKFANGSERTIKPDGTIEEKMPAEIAAEKNKSAEAKKTEEKVVPPPPKPAIGIDKSTETKAKPVESQTADPKIDAARVEAKAAADRAQALRTEAKTARDEAKAARDAADALKATATAAEAKAKIPQSKTEATKVQETQSSGTKPPETQSSGANTKADVKGPAQKPAVPDASASGKEANKAAKVNEAEARAEALKKQTQDNEKYLRAQLEGNESLSIDGRKFSDADMQTIAKLAKERKEKQSSPIIGLEIGPNMDMKDISSAGFGELSKLEDITRLALRNKTADQLLSHIKDLKNLKELDFTSTGAGITDNGLAHLKDMKNVTTLRLGDTKITDIGLKHLQGMTNLQELDLSSNSQITNDGLSALKNLTNLERLGLDHTKIDDKGLDHFVNLPKLTGAGIGHAGTKITDEKLAQVTKKEKLAPSSEKVKTEAKPSETETKAAAEAKAFADAKADIEAKLKLGNKQILEIAEPKKVLSDAYMRAIAQVAKEKANTQTPLLGLTIGPEVDMSTVNPAGYAELANLPNLALLGLNNEKINDKCLANLVGLTKLEELQLIGSGITDDGLAQLKTLESLETLNLQGTSITGRGLAHLVDPNDPKKSLQNLSELGLSETKITDEGLAGIEGLKSLTHVELNATAITDKGIAHLNGLDNLVILALQNNAQITDDGLAKQAGLRRLGTLDVSGATKISGSGLGDFKNLVQLFIQRAAVTNDGLATIGKLSQLEVLDLAGNAKLTNDGLAKIKNLINLEALDISNNANFTDGALKHLYEMKQLQKLVTERTKITARAVDELDRKLHGQDAAPPPHADPPPPKPGSP